MGNTNALGGYTIKGLREWATDLANAGFPVKGRSKMTGTVLLRAVQEMNDRYIKSLEDRVLLNALAGTSGVKGRIATTNCGCRILITSDVQRANLGNGRYQSRYVHGQYLTLCRHHVGDYPAGVDYMNRQQETRPHRFFLWNMKAISHRVGCACPRCLTDGATVRVIADVAQQRQAAKQFVRDAGRVVEKNAAAIADAKHANGEPVCDCDRRPGRMHQTSCAVILHEVEKFNATAYRPLATA